MDIQSEEQRLTQWVRSTMSELLAANASLRSIATYFDQQIESLASALAKKNPNLPLQEAEAKARLLSIIVDRELASRCSGRDQVTTYYLTYTYQDGRSAENRIDSPYAKFGVPDPNPYLAPVVFTINSKALQQGTTVWIGLTLFDHPTEGYFKYPIFSSAEEAADYLLLTDGVRDSMTDYGHSAGQVKRELLTGRVYNSSYSVVEVVLP